MDCTKNPLDWGWRLSEGAMVPRETDQRPAPDELLDVVVCNCKKDCTSKLCSCRKHGLECTTACGICKGVSCTNSLRADID